jgi:hypothetical protein
MTVPSTDGVAPPSDRAERFRDYFRIQLQFAQRLAEMTGRPFGEVVTSHTNLHRRFGLGQPVPGDEPSPLWRRYLEGLDGLGPLQARSEWTQAIYAEAPEEQLLPGRRAFGCFGCEPPNQEGAVQIHFTNIETDPEVGPLDRRRQAARREELRTMFTVIRADYPGARCVIGGSWLYNLEAYRRLLPPEYGDSRTAPEGPARLTGASMWGQLLDHRGAVKPEVEAVVLGRLPNLDPEALWRVFPLRAMKTRADIGAFYDFLDL